MIPFRKHFITGLAVVLPLVLTLVIIQYLFKAADSWIAGPIYSVLPFRVDKNIAVFSIKVLILIALLLAIYLVGWATQILIVKQILKFGEDLLDRVPMVNRVYSTMKEMATAFMGDRKDLFRTAVLIEYPRKGIYSIAFVTGTSHRRISEKMAKDFVSVFVPTTPNPTSGMLLFVPREEIVELAMTVEEAIKLVISGGTVASITHVQAKIPPPGSADNPATTR